ncbi:MAG: OmpW family outer membrane protein [Rickettsiales bacterium]
MRKLLLTTAILASMIIGAQANEGDLLLRLRAIDVIPDENSHTSIGGYVDADFSIVPEVDVTYFFTDNIAAELIAATSKHDVSAKNTTLGDLDLGEVWVLPPTLTLQYHFVNESCFKPYVGAGVNFTYFYNDKAGSSINTIEYDHSFGPALQAGVDYKIDDKYSLNLDVKKVWMNTDVKINGGAVTADVDLDPWIVGVGIGYTF